MRITALIAASAAALALAACTPAADDKPARTTHGLATVTVLYPVDCPATTRVQILADALAA